MTRPEDSLTVGGGAAHQRQAPGADRLVNGLVYQIRFFEKATMNHEELFLSWRLNALNAWENSHLPPTYEWQKEVKSVSALIRIFSIGSSDPSLSNCPGPNPTMIFLFTTKGWFFEQKIWKHLILNFCRLLWDTKSTISLWSVAFSLSAGP